MLEWALLLIMSGYHGRWLVRWVWMKKRCHWHKTFMDLSEELLSHLSSGAGAYANARVHFSEGLHTSSMKGFLPFPSRIWLASGPDPLPIRLIVTMALYKARTNSKPQGGDDDGEPVCLLLRPGRAMSSAARVSLAVATANTGLFKVKFHGMRRSKLQ